MTVIESLLAGSIDYAGLFPPAGLDMPSAVRNYARYRNAPDAWALGRFVLPAARLGEFEAAAAGHIQHDTAKRSWQLSALAGPDLEADLETIAGFNRRHIGDSGSSAAVDTLEIKATSERTIEEIMGLVPRDLPAFIEVPVDDDPAGLLTEIARLGGRAKVRTGGVTAQAFPETADLLRFIRGCVSTRLPFKATAGLHHPLRAEYRLTYERGSPAAPMFGFMNLFLTTAFLRAGRLSDTDATRLLEERSPEAFQVTPQSVVWRGQALDLHELQLARQEGMVSFGSCSFTEPLTDLAAIHLLPKRADTV